MLLLDARDDRAPRPWTEGDADEAGLATDAVCTAAVASGGRETAAEAEGGGRGGGGGTSAGMSETTRAGEFEATGDGDGDAVAEAEAEAVLETGRGLLSWLAPVLMMPLLLSLLSLLSLLTLLPVLLSRPPCPVASPAIDSAGAVGGGACCSCSWAPAEAMIPSTRLAVFRTTPKWS